MRFGPDLELLGGGGPEGVRRAQQARSSLRLPGGGELPDGRGLARPVHADHEDDPGLLRERTRGASGLSTMDRISSQQERPHGLGAARPHLGAARAQMIHGLPEPPARRCPPRAATPRWCRGPRAERAVAAHEVPDVRVQESARRRGPSLKRSRKLPPSELLIDPLLGETRDGGRPRPTVRRGQGEHEVVAVLEAGAGSRVPCRVAATPRSARSPTPWRTTVRRASARAIPW